MYVNRDAFAREELHKESVKGTCTWCGNTNRHGKVWKYRLEPDSIVSRKNEIAGTFCNLNCLRAYHN